MFSMCLCGKVARIFLYLPNSKYFSMKKFLLLAWLIPFTLFSQNKQLSKYDDSVLLSKVKYRLVGPFRGGRSGAVGGDYKQKNTFYFGSTGGGVWKTIDGGS